MSYLTDRLISNNRADTRQINGLEDQLDAAKAEIVELKAEIKRLKRCFTIAMRKAAKRRASLNT